jgi:glycosyltransferase involved in cell wall biosynthesis
MNRIKILFGLEATEGGALRHLVFLVTNLNRELFDVTIVLSNNRLKYKSRDLEKLEKSNIAIRYISMSREVNLFKDLFALFKIWALIRINNYDVVHAHSSKAGFLFRIAAWLNKVKTIIYTPHCFYFQGLEGFKRLVFLKIEKFLSLVTNYIIVSKMEKKAALKVGLCPGDKLVNINNAIDFDENKVVKNLKQVKNELGIEGDTVVGAIGRLTRQKDWKTYILAAKEVLELYPDIKFLIVGEGEQKDELKTLIFDLDLQNKVMMTGYIEEIEKIYAVIDIYVSSSLWEGLPYVFLEAMHHRKPIVATNLGHEELVEDGINGYLVPKQNYKVLSSRIASLISQKQKLKQYGENSKLLIQTDRYCFKKFISEHTRIYTKATFFAENN